MESVVEFLVHQGSYGLLFLALVVAGLGIPLPEDLVMISGAILVQRGLTNFALTVAVLAVGVLLGDTILFFMARRVGTGIYKWRIMKRVMPPARREWVEQKIAKHGGLVVFCARHVAGFRAPTFAIAAIHGIPYSRFILFDALGLTISLPLWMAIGWFFGDSIDQLMNHTATAERIVTAAALGVVILGLTIHAIVAAFRRKREDAARNSLPTSPSSPSANRT